MSAPVPKRAASLARQWLKHADPVSFGVEERDIRADARNIHRLAEHLAAGLGDLLHRLGDVVHRDDHGRILRGPVGLLLEEATVDGTWFERTAGAAFGRVRQNVVAHFRTE